MRLKQIYILIAMVFVGLAVQAVLVSPVSAAYVSQGITTSTNLLSGSSASSINNFHYNIATLPGNSSVRIQFSNDNAAWYSSAGVLNGWDTLSATGGADLSLSALGWSGAVFYYKLETNSTSDLSGTPTIEDIRLDYTPTSGYEKVFVFDNFGNVGIGTTLPSGKMDIHGAGIGTGVNTQWADLTGAAKVTILDNGSVGIGIASPLANLNIGQTATATGALKGIIYTGAVNTNQTLSTEISSVTITTAGRQWATGALTTQREFLITQPTYSFVGASTITDAATLAIAGAPIKSTNATITNTHALLIQAGAVSTAVNSYGLTVNAQTGATNNYAAVFLGGNVGIGTTSPFAKLSVTGTTAQVNPLFVVDYSATGTATSTALLINSSGYLGISSTSPSSLFSVGSTGTGFNVNNSGTITAGTWNASIIGVTYGGTGSSTLTANGILYGNGTGAIQATAQGAHNYILYSNNGTPAWTATTTLFTQGTDTLPTGTAGQTLTYQNSAWTATSTLTVADNGNVGIGTTSPGAKLAIDGAAGSTSGLQITNLGTATYGIDMRNSGLTSSDYYFYADSSNYWASGGGGLLAAGSLSMSSIQTSLLKGTSSGSFLTVQGGDTTPGSQILLYGGTAAAPNTGIIIFKVGAASSEAMRIDTSGNVGIGTTSPYSKLSVWGAGTSTNRLFELTNNASTTLLSMLESGDLNIPVTTATTTIGGGLSVAGSSGLTVLQNGYLGIGTTSPSTTLSVSGNGYITGGLGIGIATSTAGVIQTTGMGYFGSNIYSAGLLSITGVGTSTIASNLWVQDTLQVGTGSTYLTSSGINFSTLGTITTGTGALTFQPAAGQNLNINLSTAGDFIINTSQFYVDTSAGTIGIGTTSPLAALTASSTSAITALFDQRGISDILQLQANGLTVMNVTSGGLMGIASTSPWATLSINGASGRPAFAIGSSSVQFIIDQNGNTGIGTTSPSAALTASSTNYITALFDQRGTNDILQLQAGGESKLVVNSSGFLGIGTTSPLARLTASSTTDIAALFDQWGTNDILQLQAAGVTKIVVNSLGYMGMGTTSPYAMLSLNAPPGVAAFYIGSSTTSFIVDARGYVGIGTNSPTVALDVRGGIRTGSYTTANRPSASAVGAGTFIFDSTLGRPYVSDGVNWNPMDSRLPDTGQITVYASSSPGVSIGDDPYYTSANSRAATMSYATSTPAANGEMVALDQETGLMWQGCSDGQTGADCSGGAAVTVKWYDSTTNTYPAVNYCEGLAYAGYSDWRLPNAKELWSIALLEPGAVAYPGKAAGAPYITQHVFKNTVSSSYWSSTTYPVSTAYALRVIFSNGGVDVNLKSNSSYVRCVRGQ